MCGFMLYNVCVYQKEEEGCIKRKRRGVCGLCGCMHDSQKRHRRSTKDRETGVCSPESEEEALHIEK